MDYNSKRFKKIIIAIIVVLSVSVVGVVVWLISGQIMNVSYSTKDILSTTEPTTKEVVIADGGAYGYSAEEWDSMSAIDKTLTIMNNVDTTNLEEASLKKATIFLSCSESPWYQYMADASYEIGKVESGYRINYNINGEELSVICSWYDATPVVYVKNEEFSEDEKRFFKNMGRCWEVDLDDGTHSIQYR